MLCSSMLLLMAALPVFVGWCEAESPPRFTAGQARRVVAVRGGSAELQCHVDHLGDKAVMWVRTRDLHILSHAGGVFTADSRFTVTVSGETNANEVGERNMDKTAGDVGETASEMGEMRRTDRVVHTLMIDKLKTSDAGQYECQVNMDPKMSLMFNLTVLEDPLPVLRVWAPETADVWASAGGAATLSCAAAYGAELPADGAPLDPIHIRWFRGPHAVDLQSGRGGVSLDTRVWPARAESRLTLSALDVADSGVYTCAAGVHATAIRLHVRRDPELLEAMQRDQSVVAHDGSTKSHADLLVASIVVILVMLQT